MRACHSVSLDFCAINIIIINHHNSSPIIKYGNLIERELSQRGFFFVYVWIQNLHPETILIANSKQSKHILYLFMNITRIRHFIRTWASHSISPGPYSINKWWWLYCVTASNMTCCHGYVVSQPSSPNFFSLSLFLLYTVVTIITAVITAPQYHQLYQSPRSLQFCFSNTPYHSLLSSHLSLHNQFNPI